MGAPNIWVKDHEMWWLHSNDADIILRYETLQEDLNFLGDFGVDIPQLDQVNVTTKRPMREYRPLYTEETRRWVAEKFRDEIERFNYRF